MFANMQFTPDRQAPPDAIPAKCWEADPRLCTGVVLFDILVGNDDRRTWNLAVDDPVNPKEIIIYDHDCAVASDMYGDARVRLKSRQDDFLAENNCLLPFVDTDEHFSEWVGRIQSIPKWYVDEVCMEAKSKGFLVADAKAAAKFIYYRSQFIDHLIKTHKERFVAIPQWTVML